MRRLLEKKEIIHEAEERFAYDLAKELLPKPAMSVWMILIPIIIVFHMYRHQQVMNSRREFVENYLISRFRALEEAFRSLEKGDGPDISNIVSKADDLPASVLPAYRTWMRELTDHFTDLLSSSGDSYAELVRSAYRSKSEYLFDLNALNRCERDFNAQLKLHMAESSPDASAAFDAMEKGSENLRRIRAEKIYTPRRAVPEGG